MGRVDDQATPLIDAQGVGVGGVCRTDDLWPCIADRLLRRWPAYPVLCAEAVYQLDEFLGRAPADAPRVLGGNLPKGCDQVLS